MNTTAASNLSKYLLIFDNAADSKVNCLSFNSLIQTYILINNAITNNMILDSTIVGTKLVNNTITAI